MRYRLRSAMHQVTCYAPGSTSNVGPGFDCLGIAIAGMGDRVSAARSDSPGVRVLAVSDPRIPCDPARNTAALAAAEVLRQAGAAGARPRPAGREGPPALRRARRQRGLGGGRRLRGKRAPRPPARRRGPAALRPGGRGRGGRPPPRQRRTLPAGRRRGRARDAAAALRAPHRPPLAAPRVRDPGLRRRDRPRPRRPPRERPARRRGGAGLGPGRPRPGPRARATGRSCAWPWWTAWPSRTASRCTLATPAPARRPSRRAPSGWR